MSRNKSATPAWRWALIAWSGLVAPVVAAPELRPFSTDGCSLFPDGTVAQQNLWLACCIEHDRAYWLGGSYAERVAADEQLHGCVHALGETLIGAVMLAGVRAGGSPFWPTPYRWGYGWPYPRGYAALTELEQAQVRQVMGEMPAGGINHADEKTHAEIKALANTSGNP